MEITEESLDRIIEEIRFAANSIQAGTITVKIQTRPEDLKRYDVIYGVEKRERFERPISTTSSYRRDPREKF
ncbi:MAG: hypothetical protein Ta2B_14270 [Termitinemataceae bacterium]|nr:MAG: hypothetical protein Ta2B_14270 [Termitinemataceae bacterium]